MTPWSTSAPIFSSCSPLACMNRYSKRTRLFPGQAIDLAIQEPEDPDERQAQAPGARELAVGPAADRHHHAARFDRLERAEQRVAPLRVEDHVLILGHLFEAGRLVVDGHIRAERLHQRVILGAGSGRDLRAEVFGQLDGEGADAARAGVDQHLLSRLQLCEFDQRLPGGEPHQRKRRRLHVVEARGLRRRGAFAHQGILGEGADAILVEARIDRVADLESGDAWADRFHVAGEIVAEDQRKRVGDQHLHDAVADLVVERVDAGGAHAHQQIARARLGPRQLHHFHRSLVTTDGQRFHGGTRAQWLRAVQCSPRPTLGSITLPLHASQLATSERARREATLPDILRELASQPRSPARHPQHAWHRIRAAEQAPQARATLPDILRGPRASLAVQHGTLNTPGIGFAPRSERHRREATLPDILRGLASQLRWLSAPRRIRTYDPRIRSPMLYPAELGARSLRDERR